MFHLSIEINREQNERSIHTLLSYIILHSTVASLTPDHKLMWLANATWHMAAFLQKFLCLNFLGMHLCSYPHSNEWEMHFQRCPSNVNLLAVLRHAVCVFVSLLACLLDVTLGAWLHPQFHLWFQRLRLWRCFNLCTCCIRLMAQSLSCHLSYRRSRMYNKDEVNHWVKLLIKQDILDFHSRRALV